MKIFISTNDIWNLINFRGPLLLELKKNKHEIIILTNIKAKNNFLKNNKLKVYNINFRANFNLINDFINFIKIAILFLRHKPDISLNFTIKPILLCSVVCKLFQIKCINTVTGFGNFYLKSKLSRNFFVIFYKFFTSRKNYFFFHNQTDYNFFIKKKISKIKKSFITMGSGVNLKKFQYLNPVLKKKINFLMISRLIYNKGVLEFFEAAKLLKNNQNFYFELIGKASDDNLNEIKQSELIKYKDLNNLKISNFTTNIKKKLNYINYLILPSYREGMSKSLMEAMASGIPVIVSKVAGNVELVKDNFNGFFCRPRNHKSLYKTILKVSKLRQKKYSVISKNCRKFSENYLDEKKVVFQYMALIKKIK